jgi:type IV pilus assembly protein PilM
MFGSKTRLVGLDIGSKAIKAAEVIEGKKGYTLSRFGMVDIAPGLIEDGAIKDPEALADILRNLFKSYGFKNHNVAISIGGYSVIVKKISVQNTTEEQLQDTIQFEAEQYIPFDINDVNLDFQMLGENENNPNQMNVLLVAAKKRWSTIMSTWPSWPGWSRASSTWMPLPCRMCSSSITSRAG